MSLLLSAADQKLYVYRNGVEIGFSRVGLKDPDEPLPEGVHAVLEGYLDKESPFAPGHKMHRWMSVATDGTSGVVEKDETALAERVHIPPFFVEQVYEALSPGATLVITNRAATPETKSDSDFVIMATHPPAETSE